MVHDLAISAIPPHWTVTTLGQYLDINGGTIQTGPFGSQLHASDYVEQGIPSVMPKNITVEKIDDSDIARISVEDAERLSKYLLQSGDIIYSRRGDVEKCSLVTDVENGWLCGTGCLRVRLNCEDKDKLSKFLHAYLSSPMIREWISRNAVGATMPNLNTSILRDVPLIIPEPYKIDFIGSMWTRFNNKITLNRQINQTLEQMAQALFKSWFVDFDPVIDNALDAGFFDQNSDLPEELLRRAEQRKIVRVQSDFKPLPAKTRQLFPAAFEECEEPSLGLGGWGPKGWKTKTLGEITIDLRRGISPKYTDEDGVLVINQKCIRNHELSFDIARKHNSALKSIAGRELNIGDVLVNSTGVGTLGRIAQVTYLQGATVVDSHVTVVRVNDTECPIYTFGQLMLSMEASIERLGEGSTGQTELSRKVLSEQYVILPPLKLTQEIERTFQSIAEKQSSARNECINLSKLRDTLLPKLISGELRLNDDGTLTDENTNC
ncbi:EcoKI restriction-modification system protein HsdS [Plesiomonas shigelloides]|uniref:restriction endonuclease subunit S n=1 Tax=Plesiomonas shigelloides TaxID=703 RepID=UPI000DFEA616|nr:restriction endonuclease subunit S [Plesiomonas shigelloides]SUB64933.1 EcoKI restriction-modification system protein HsdS [Plesiomonas shigelloides]